MEKWIYALAMGGVLLVAVLVVVSTLQRQWAVRHRSAPDIGGLTDVLKKTAEKTLAPPALVNEQIVIAAPRGDIEARAKQVIDAAIETGGTAVKTTSADGSATVLTQVPNLNADFFRGLVRGEQRTKPTAVREGDMTLIEVLISPPEASPPPAAARP